MGKKEFGVSTKINKRKKGTKTKKKRKKIEKETKKNKRKKGMKKNLHCLTYWTLKESPLGQEKSIVHKRGKEESLCN